MLNNGSVRRQTSTLNMSKFWAFRLINVVSFLSIFLLLSILVIPIPYLHKEREPSIIDLNLNLNGCSHAIKINSKKLPGKVISVSYTTHNSDHIIGSTYFGNISLERNSEYLARYVNCHYQDKRRGLPFRVLVIDVYSKVFIFKRFLLLDNQESSYKPIEGTVYMIPEYANRKVLDISLVDLMEEVPSSIYRLQYEDMDEKIITQYFPDDSHMLGTITFGQFEDDLPEDAIYRTLTTVSINSPLVFKAVLTTFYKNNPDPLYKEYYFSYDDMEHFYETVEELSKALNVSLTHDSFEVNRYENNKTNTIYYNNNKHDNEGLLIFELKHEKHRYEIVVADKKDSIVKLKKKVYDSDDLKSEENPLDRVLVIEYNNKEPKPPNYYIWDRMLYFNRLTNISHRS